MKEEQIKKAYADAKGHYAALGMGQSFFEPGSVMMAFSWSILMSLNVVFSNVWGIILFVFSIPYIVAIRIPRVWLRQEEESPFVWPIRRYCKTKRAWHHFLCRRGQRFSR